MTALYESQALKGISSGLHTIQDKPLNLSEKHPHVAPQATGDKHGGSCDQVLTDTGGIHRTRFLTLPSI